MTSSSPARLYVIALALVVFFLGWAVVAARPWVSSAQDPRLKALAAQQTALRRDAALVHAVLAKRAAVAQKPAQVALAVPAVRVVNLPPLTVTRTS